VNEKNSTSIGSRLREERERLGLSQEALAATLAISRRTQAAWEQGAQYPNAEALSRASAAGVDVLYVVTNQRSIPVESTLSDGERALLADYKRADDDGKAAARKVLASLARPERD